MAAISWWNFNCWGIASWDEKRKWLLEMKSSLGEDALEIVEITRKDSLHQLSWQSCGRVWEDSLQFLKKFYCAFNAIKHHFMLQIINLWREESINASHFTVILRNCYWHPSAQQPCIWPINIHEHWGKILHEQKRLWLAEGLDDG